MRLLEKNGEIIYHSKRNINDEGLTYYDVPVGIRANPMPVSIDWTRVAQGQSSLDVRKFLISRDSLRDTLVFNPYGYDHAIYGESSFGLDDSNPYGWVEEYITRWINNLAKGDLFYVDVTPPEDYTEYIQGKNADYEVIGIENTPNYMGIIIKGIT